MTIAASKWRAVRWAPTLSVGVVAALALGGVSSTGQTRTLAPVLRTDTIARVATERAASVVFLHTLSQGSPQQELAGRLPRLLTQLQEGLGSGVVIDASGLILTNAHVVDGANAIHVRTPAGDDGDASVVGIDRELDLALLRTVDLSGLRAAPLGDSDRLNVGDWVVAIGSPLGLHHTVTAGIISAKARGLDDSGVEFLQTDAAINPGSSGGALLNLEGALVGITTAIVSGGGENIGLNFAIPIQAVKDILPQLRTGTVIHGWIGMKTMRLSRAGARTLGIESGLVVIALAENGPAERAGIRFGEVVLGIGGPSPVPAPDAQRRILDTAPGTTIALTIWRDQRRVDVPVEVGTRPRQP